MGCLEETNICIRKLIRMMNHPKPISKQETVYLGVDVGTANVVTVAVDAAGQPLGGKISAARVVREGMIVDYLQAVDIVTNHVESLKDELDHELIYASSSFPPGTETGNIRVTENILEAARLQIVGMIDEPTVAATALGINNGIVVDVGGGTTGVSILKDGKAIKSYDEATGGFQFDLVIAGCLKITTQEAEAIKRDAGQQKKNATYCSTCDGESVQHYTQSGCRIQCG